MTGPPLFPELSVAGYVVKADLLTHSPQENLPDFPAVNCTCVYKEKLRIIYTGAYPFYIFGDLETAKVPAPVFYDVVMDIH